MVLAFDDLSESASAELLQRLIPICKMITRDDLVESTMSVESVVVLSDRISAEST